MTISSKLEEARSAAAELSRKQQLADSLPQLEKEAARLQEIQDAEARGRIAEADLNEMLQDYHNVKVKRDRQLENWLTSTLRLIATGQTFDSLCDRQIDKAIGNLAIAQLVQRLPQNQIDRDMVIAHKQEIAKSMSIYPLCKFNGDRSGVKQQFLSLLSEYIALNW